MTHQQLLYFCTIAELLNYTKASEKLYVSQSSLSHSIQALEYELQASLFIRNSGKKISLTRFGKKLLPYAKKVLADVAEIEALAKAEKNPLSGVVKAAYSFINAYEVLNLFDPFLLDAKNQCISIDFDVTHNTRPTEQRLIDGDIDIAFNATGICEGIETFPIAKQPLYVMISSNNPLSQRESLSIQDIADEPFIHYHPISELHKRIVKMFDTAGVVPNETACYEDWFSQVSAVSLNMGVGISPRLAMETPRVKFVPLDDPLNTRTLYMLWASDRELPAVAEYVKNYCMDCAEMNNEQQ